MADHLSYYDTSDKVESYIRKDAAWVDFTHRILLDLLKDLPASGRALDVGCGYGRDVKTLLDQGYEAIGVDQSAAMIEKAITQYGPHFQTLPLQKLADLPGKFDLVWCRNVLVHVIEDDLSAALEKICTVVAPDGHLVLISKVGQGISITHTTGSPRETILHSKEKIAQHLQDLGMRLLEDPFLLPSPSANGDRLFCVRARKIEKPA